MIDSTLVTDDLELAIRILVHETRTTLGALRPVIAGLESGAPLPAAGAAVARLDAIERVLARVAAVYRRRLALRDQLSPAELAQLRAAVAGLSSVQAVEELMVPGPPGPPRLAEELEIALRVLVHEVGNALTAIKPLVDVLASRPGWLLALPAGQRVASARLALARLDDTAQLLVQVGDLRPRLQPVPLAGLLAAVAAAERQAARARQVELAVACPLELVARADPLWLRHSLSNLADNAVRATPPGGQVRLSAGERGGRVAVSVSDDGPGLGQDELDYVFHADLAARTRLRRPLAPGGLGLGLSLVRYWVRAMGGRVEARSRPAGPARGPGTDVAVILPAVDQR